MSNMCVGSSIFENILVRWRAIVRDTFVRNWAAFIRMTSKKSKIYLDTFVTISIILCQDHPEHKSDLLIAFRPLAVLADSILDTFGWC